VLVLLVFLLSPLQAADSFPARPYLQAQLVQAALQFPDDVRQQRCWAATQAIWHYTHDTFGPELAESWLAPWWSDGQWRKLCDGQGLRDRGSRHWGVACPYKSCPEGDGPYISLNHDRIYAGRGSLSLLDARYYYVMAHEMAHAIGHYYADPDWANDHWADGVARAFGASVCPHSPYCGNVPPYPGLATRESMPSIIVPPASGVSLYPDIAQEEILPGTDCDQCLPPH
jgi:hypothetical protein